jgi:hypothetical protein
MYISPTEEKEWFQGMKFFFLKKITSGYVSRGQHMTKPASLNKLAAQDSTPRNIYPSCCNRELVDLAATDPARYLQNSHALPFRTYSMHVYGL